MTISLLGPIFQEGEKRIYRKLDWCFANQSWYSNRSVKAPFRFFNIWCNHPEFFRIVEKIWTLQIRGSMYRVYHRFKLLQGEMRTLNKKTFDNVSERISNCRAKLEEVRRRIAVDSFNVEIQREKKNKIVQLQELIT